MNPLLVVNTGPIIAIHRGGAVEIVKMLPFDFCSPEEVMQELRAGEAEGHPAVDMSWLRTAPLQQRLSRFGSVVLDPGEAAVIQLAVELGAGTVCIDERKGRRVAQALGLRVTGTLGLLGVAKMLGFVPAVRPIVERVQSSGVWFAPEMVATFLTSLGE